LRKLAVASGEEHGDRAVRPGAGGLAPELVRLGVRHLHQRRPPLRPRHGAGGRLRGRGVLDAALRVGACARAGLAAHAGAAAPELGLAHLHVQHALHPEQEHAHQHWERRDRGVGSRVPPLRLSSNNKCSMADESQNHVS